MKRNIVLMTVIFSMLVSCSGEIPLILRLSDNPPFADKVNVVSKMNDTDSGMLSLSWKEDTGAESYIVMRAADGTVLDFKKIYEGRNLYFEDREFESNKAYVYRLDKRRGDRIFKGEEYSYGYYYASLGAVLSDDIYEDNNTLQRAVRLEDRIDANVYAVKFNTNEKLLYDEDWFYVSVPAGFNLQFSISQNYPEITSGQTHLKLYVSTKSGEDESVTNGTPVVITNNLSTEQNIYFRITVDTDSVFSGLSSGSQAVSYTLRLDRLSR